MSGSQATARGSPSKQKENGADKQEDVENQNLKKKNCCGRPGASECFHSSSSSDWCCNEFPNMFVTKEVTL